jgi:hypothetical protein
MRKSPWSSYPLGIFLDKRVLFRYEKSSQVLWFIYQL